MPPLRTPTLPADHPYLSSALTFLPTIPTPVIPILDTYYFLDQLLPTVHIATFLRTTLPSALVLRT